MVNQTMEANGSTESLRKEPEEFSPRRHSKCYLIIVKRSSKMLAKEANGSTLDRTTFHHMEKTRYQLIAR